MIAEGQLAVDPNQDGQFVWTPTANCLRVASNMGSFGVRSYLFALLGASTAVPIVVFGLHQAERHALEVSQRYDETLSLSANAAALRVGDFFSARKQDLETLAAGIAANGTLRGETSQHLLDAHFQSSGAYVGTYLGDPAGTAVVRAHRLGTSPDPEPQTMYRDRDYYRDVVSTRKTVFSRAQLGKLIDLPTVQMATPIETPEGEFLGYAEGSIDLAYLEPILLQAKGPSQDRHVSLIDGTGRVVLDASRTLPALADVSRMELFELDPLGPKTARDDLQTPMRGTAVEVPGMPRWRVVAAEPLSNVTSLAENERRKVWWAAGVAGCLALLVSAAVSTWLARRFRRLASQLQALSDPRLEAPVLPDEAWGPRELVTLQRQVTRLGQELVGHRRHLENEVEARTAELARANERLNLLVHALERAEDGIAIVDERDEFTYVNPALESISGYSAGEMLGKTAHQLGLDPGDEDERAERRRTLASGTSHRAIFAARRADGTLFEQECATWPVTGRGGEASHYVTLRKDVTALRRTEQSLRLSERLASLGTLAAGVAHEINNPLTYVLLSLRLAQRQLDRHYPQLPTEYYAKSEAALNNALDGAERVSEIVKDLRLFSRADETTIAIVEPRSVIESALRLMGNDLRHRARIVRDYRPAPEVSGNHAKLHQVFLNLFINASHAIEEAYGSPDSVELGPVQAREPQIRITTDTDANGDCEIRVSDTGAGIQPEHLPRIFDPFFTTKPVGVGTGLGLAMCRNIVTAMGGLIEVQSEVGVGTTFRVVLPKAQGVSPAPSANHTQRRMRLPAASILVVDDDRAVGDSVAAVLGDEHHVDVVEGGQQALNRTREKKYDAILCDLKMPQMNGIELFLALRNEGRDEQRRLVFFTGAPLSEGARRFLEQHALHCLQKPVTEEQLHGALRDVLTSSSVSSPRPQHPGHRSSETNSTITG